MADPALGEVRMWVAYNSYQQMLFPGEKMKGEIDTNVQYRTVRVFLSADISTDMLSLQPSDRIRSAWNHKISSWYESDIISN